MIETERLLLRRWRAEDRAPFLAMSQSPQVMACLGGPATEAEVEAAIARAQACQAEHGFCFWAMERRGDGQFVGFCGLKPADAHPAIAGEIEIGWRLRADLWDQGLAREAALATLRWAWGTLAAPRVIAMTIPANRRSWGLMERIGMRPRPELDFGHPLFPEHHPLRQHIVYMIDRPAPLS